MICDFCYRHCSIWNGEKGWCKVRENSDGTIRSLNYGQIPALALDPVEKKPLYHFLPGTRTLSLGASGCNLACDFCQNWMLSQNHEKGEYLNKEDIVAYSILNNIPSISFTYSEPLVWQDYMIDTARKAKEHGVKTIMVSNGSFSAEALERIVQWIDAFNIDLKGNAAFYSEICHGRIEPVLNAIEYLVKNHKHVEITTMIIEGIHDESMIDYIGRELHEKGVMVWHLTRFFPNYKMNKINPTSELYLSQMIQVARESRIPFIYPGNSNLPAPTTCPACGNQIREKPGLTIPEGECGYCGTKIYGTW